MSEPLTRFLGDTPLRTAIKLLVISLAVGIIMAAFDFTPLDVWYMARGFATWLYDLGYEAFGRVGIYLVYGAIVVLPVFLFMRLVAIRKR